MCFSEIESYKIDDHLAADHSIQLETKTLEFGSVEEYQTWKTCIEAKTKANFVRIRGSYKTNNIKSSYLTCSRNGCFKSKSNNLRHLKSKGSTKINGYCPAKMRVIEKNGGKINVLYTETHVGHEHALEHLLLTKGERQYLAEKIAAKIPYDEILNEVRGSVRDNEVSRIHLLTRQDLCNIQKSPKFNRIAIGHKKDTISEL